MLANLQESRRHFEFIFQISHSSLMWTDFFVAFWTENSECFVIIVQFLANNYKWLDF